MAAHGPEIGDMEALRYSNAGKPVLLLHGICSTGASMRPMADALRHRGYHVTAPTLAETLRTGLSSDGLDLAKLSLHDYFVEARDHALVIAKAHGVRPLVIGHSNGALMALALAGCGCVHAAILAAPAPPPSVKGAPFWVRRLLFARIFGNRWSNRPVQFQPRWPFGSEQPPDHLVASMCPDSGQAMADALAPSRGGVFDPPPPLPCPAVVVAGERDRLVPLHLAQAIARRFDLEITVVKDAGHWLIGDSPSIEKIVDAAASITVTEAVAMGSDQPAN